MKKNCLLDNLQKNDHIVFNSLANELKRQQNQLEMIASENFVSPAIMAITGSCLTNKYAEGYPGKRYYNGCEFVDELENLAISRATKLFNCEYANVQPHSGSQANQAVFLALLKPFDTVLSMGLDAGGHLSHGSKVNMSGKWFNIVNYGIRANDHLIDIEQVEKLALTHKPKLIIAGGSAYPRAINFAAFRQIANKVGAMLMVDMAHFAGLVAGMQMENPLPFADVVTTTTHKTIRGPRGGLILTNNLEISNKINSAVFPGLQGGPLMHIVAAKAVAFQEALSENFQNYSKQVILNAQTLAQVLQNRGLSIVTGGTDCHLVLLNLCDVSISGHEVANALEEVNITCNKNAIFQDPRPPRETSGLRFGSPALTTRGMKESEFIIIANCIADTIYSLKQGVFMNEKNAIQNKAIALCHDFPLYSEI